MLLAAIALIAQIAQIAPVAPIAPAPTPPPVIIEVHSARTLCTTLTKRVQPAVGVLMKNDAIIGDARIALTRAGAGGGHAAVMALSDAVYALRHNLSTVGQILDDPARFPASPKSVDEQTAADIKAKLVAFQAREELVVNAVYGTWATEQLGSMRTEFPLGNPMANPDGGGVTAGGSLLSAAGLNDPHVISMASLMDTGMIGTTLSDHLASLVAENQVETLGLEAEAASAIVRAAASCKS